MEYGVYKKTCFAIQFENTNDCEDIFVKCKIPYKMIGNDVAIETHEEGTMIVSDGEWITNEDGFISVLTDRQFHKEWEEDESLTRRVKEILG